MHGQEKSDSPVLPRKSPNNTGRRVTEEMEGRGLAKEKSLQADARRTQGRASVHSRLERLRQAAQSKKEVKFTALFHHVYDIDMLREAYFRLKREAAPGVDGETWQHYGESLEDNLQNLADRLKRGAYRAKPVKRVYIPKADGRQRPLGVTALEDKIVQRSLVAVLNAIYESEFLGFSYGFRPGRSPHRALDALSVGLLTKKVNFVLDADIRGYYEAISHGWLVKFVEHRIGDRRVVRLIQKWLKAGVLEEGRWSQPDEGTPQGSSVSPVLSNIYLNHVFDQWVQWWRQRQARGEVIVVRWADDFIVGFKHRSDAERFHEALRTRLAKFGLELHPEKTRLLEFGPYAASNRRKRGQGKPETFEFLGFTHVCGRTRQGRFTVWRYTARRRLTKKLREVRQELRRRWHAPTADVGAWLRSVVGGHFRYFGVPGNDRALRRFRGQVARSWKRGLQRRSQRGHVSWSDMRPLIRRWLPLPKAYHPYPLVRFGVITQGKSPVR